MAARAASRSRPSARAASTRGPRARRWSISGAWQPLVSLALGLVATTLVSHAMGWLSQWRNVPRHETQAAAVSARDH